MKKFFGILLAVVTTLVLLPCCGGGGDDSNTDMRLTEKRFCRGNFTFQLMKGATTCWVYLTHEVPYTGNMDGVWADGEGYITGNPNHKPDGTGTYTCTMNYSVQEYDDNNKPKVGLLRLNFSNVGDEEDAAALGAFFNFQAAEGEGGNDDDNNPPPMTGDSVKLQFDYESMTWTDLGGGDDDEEPAANDLLIRFDVINR